jgi:hypothetical protein
MADTCTTGTVRLGEGWLLAWKYHDRWTVDGVLTRDEGPGSERAWPVEIRQWRHRRPARYRVRLAFDGVSPPNPRRLRRAIRAWLRGEDTGGSR